MLRVVHEQLVFARRIRVLADHFAALLPTTGEGGAPLRVLDVGAGDGRLAVALHARRPDLVIEGVDVLVRPVTAIPVQSYDGRRLPFADHSYDVVLLVDVLHHAEDGRALLRECARVARTAVLVKDHVRTGLLAGPTLALMDWVGNARYGVRLPPSTQRYWTRDEWVAAIREAGLQATAWRSELGLYAPWASWWCDRQLHMVARLEPRAPRDRSMR